MAVRAGQEPSTTSEYYLTMICHHHHTFKSIGPLATLTSSSSSTALDAGTLSSFCHPLVTDGCTIGRWGDGREVTERRNVPTKGGGGGGGGVHERWGEGEG